MTTLDLMDDYERRGHVLGRSISLEEVPALISSLLERLGLSEKDLDNSPASLHTLDKSLLVLSGDLREKGYVLSDDETMKLIREIAAYVGQVFLLHVEAATWREGGTLWGTEIVIHRPVEVIKGKYTNLHSKTVYSLGNLAAATWSVITTKGRKANLHEKYKDAISSRIEERLKGLKNGNKKTSRKRPVA